jgi:hypothetical protein
VNVNNEQVNVSGSFLEYFFDIDKIFKEYYWHMRHNILWCGKIFCHVFIEKRYFWMKMWMKNGNGRTFSWILVTYFLLWKTSQKKKDGIFLC